MSTEGLSSEYAVVVGVDGSEASLDALRWGIRQGLLTGRPVDAVLVWQYPITAGGIGWAPVVPLENFNYAEAAAKTLNDCVNKTLPLSSPVTVRQHVVRGDPAQVLVAASVGADLLVVGSRGHGEFTDALIGSVSQRCVHHASCPVVVLRCQKPKH